MLAVGGYQEVGNKAAAGVGVDFLDGYVIKGDGYGMNREETAASDADS